MLIKYRSLKSFKYFADIILNNRLYATSYFNMNDPMEGHFLYLPDGLTKELIRAIKGKKDQLRICSLSKTKENALMWAHYADGHRGVVIGVEVDRDRYDLRPVQYEGPPFVKQAEINPPIETAKRILCYKHEVWIYEEEERIFVTGVRFAKVEVKELILGSRMSPKDKSLVRKMVSKVAPNVNVMNSKVNKII